MFARRFFLPLLLTRVLFLASVFLLQASSAFLVLVPVGSACRYRSSPADSISLRSASSEDISDSTNTSSLHQALATRVAALEKGIGKRYVCRTQLGFLNVHDEPGDPYNTENIVGRLVDGQIVASTAPPQGAWIRHDGGGWSVSVYGGFVWLEELTE